MAVAEVDVDEPGREIEDPTLAGVEPRPLATRDDDLLDAGLRGPRDEDVLGRVLRDRREIALLLGGERHAGESSAREMRPPGAATPGGRSITGTSAQFPPGVTSTTVFLKPAPLMSTPWPFSASVAFFARSVRYGVPVGAPFRI